MVVKDAVRPQDLRNPTSFPCARPLWVNECFTDRTKQQPQCFSPPQKTLKNGTLFRPGGWSHFDDASSVVPPDARFADP
jgi:hypothetical protein